MVRYRRNFVAGGTFFFTLTLADRSSRALIDNVEALRAAVKKTRGSHPFSIDAVVVLPDHLHIVLTLPDGDADYTNRWRLIKRRFTDAVMKSGLRSHVIATASPRSGSVVSGSTLFGTTGTSSGTLTTFISIR